MVTLPNKTDGRNITIGGVLHTYGVKPWRANLEECQHARTP